MSSELEALEAANKVKAEEIKQLIAKRSADKKLQRFTNPPPDSFVNSKGITNQYRDYEQWRDAVDDELFDRELELPSDDIMRKYFMEKMKPDEVARKLIDEQENGWS